MAATLLALSQPQPHGSDRDQNQDLVHHRQRIQTVLNSCTSLTPHQANQIHAFLLKASPSNTPSIFLYNSLLRALCLHPSSALSLYSLFRSSSSSLLPNSYTFTFLIKALSTSPLGPAIHAQAIVFGIPTSDVFLHTALLHMYSSSGQIIPARALFDRMPHRTPATWNAMITAYCRLGLLHTARRLFNQMPARTTPTWNTMIAGYVGDSMALEALAIFHQMQLAGARPDAITLVTILPACAQLGALQLGQWLSVYGARNGLTGNIAVCNAMIDMYAKCGHIGKAMAVFRRMRERSIVSWNTMISGLAIHGRGEEAIELFEKMEGAGVVPDEITFVGLLSACGHSGFVDQARSYFKRMVEVYNIHPKIEHYGCMVDVLGRAQCLDEAQELINRMPFTPNSVILGSLLSACRLCNEFGLGEKILEKLVNLDQSNPGYYVLLSNMYASSRRWQDVMRIRNLMKSRGIEKIPGCSSIEVDNTVHEFVVGDKTHPQTQEIHAKLDQIYEKLKSVGYTPNTSIVLFDLDEEEKAQNLSFHSEKLAVAFGLLNPSTGMPLCVVNNLRICRDCHAAMKLISQVYKREIIVRDRIRFHHFRYGHCSCSDYW